MKKRLVIFAHYDKDEVIDEYVVQYLRELKKFASDIVFVSDGYLKSDEIEKIQPLVSEVIAQKHREYDFGSYKIGFFLLNSKYKEKLLNCDEVIFANDSCYLIRSLDPVFATMEEKNLDFWGLARSYQYEVNHVHSYFFAFSRQLFLSDIVRDFFNKVTAEKTKENIIKKYEIGLSKLINDSGYKVGSFLGDINVSVLGNEIPMKKIILQNFPFLKIGAFVSGCYSVTKFEKIAGADNYRIIINNLLRRIGINDLMDYYKNLTLYRKFFFHRKFFAIFLKRGKLMIKLFGVTFFSLRLKGE